MWWTWDVSTRQHVLFILYYFKMVKWLLCFIPTTNLIWTRHFFVIFDTIISRWKSNVQSYRMEFQIELYHLYSRCENKWHRVMSCHLSDGSIIWDTNNLVFFQAGDFFTFTRRIRPKFDSTRWGYKAKTAGLFYDCNNRSDLSCGS